MARFDDNNRISINKIWIILSSFFIIFFIIFFFGGINTINNSATQEQAQNLEKSIRRSIVHCYCVEGTYPPSLDYLKEHYGISYDENTFYVDYVSIGSNIMPDITIIPLYSEQN